MCSRNVPTLPTNRPAKFYASASATTGGEGPVLRPGRRQGLPAPDLLRHPQRGAALVSKRSPLSSYALRLGDDALILAQRLGEWVSSAPELEEDVAMANIALDLLGQARTLLGAS